MKPIKDYGSNMCINNENPSALVILITRRCNLDCSHCYINKKSQKELTYEQIMKGIGQFLKIDSGDKKEIIFTGGEPLLRFDIIKKVVEANNLKNVKFLLETNGILLNNQITDFLKKNDVSLTIGIDESHGTYNPLSLMKPKSEFIKILDPIANIVITHKNYKEMIHNFDYLLLAGFKKFKISPDYTQLWEWIDITGFRKSLEKFCDYYFSKKNKKIELVNLTHFREILDNKRSRNCNQIFLGNDGFYSICGGSIYFSPKTLGEHSIGDVTSEISLKRRLHLLKKLDSSSIIGINKCKTCLIKPFCYCLIQTYLFCNLNKKDFKKHFENHCYFSNVFFGVFSELNDKINYSKNEFRILNHYENWVNKCKEFTSLSKRDEISRIWFSITENCNNRCEYCFVEKKPTYMDNRVLNNTLDLLIKSYGQRKKAIIFGGEPILAFDSITSLVRLAKRKARLYNKQIEFGVGTNLVDIDKGQIDFLANKDFQISITIDGKEKIHNTYRKTKKGENTYSDIIKNLKSLQDKISDIKICGLFGVHPENSLDMYDNFMHIVDTLKINSINIEPIQNRTWDKPQIVQFKFNLIKIFNELLLRISNQNPFFINSLNLMLTEKSSEEITGHKSYPLYRNLVVFTDGSITANPFLYYIDKKYVMGNIVQKELIIKKHSFGDKEGEALNYKIIALRDHFCNKLAEYLIKKSKSDIIIKGYIEEAKKRVFE